MKFNMLVRVFIFFSLLSLIVFGSVSPPRYQLIDDIRSLIIVWGASFAFIIIVLAGYLYLNAGDGKGKLSAGWLALLGFLFIIISIILSAIMPYLVNIVAPFYPSSPPYYYPFFVLMTLCAIFFLPILIGLVVINKYLSIDKNNEAKNKKLRMGVMLLGILYFLMPIILYLLVIMIANSQSSSFGSVD